MNIPVSLPELSELFKRLGANGPEEWAKSQINEGIPQLHRYLFLRECWRLIRSDDESGWIDKEISAAKVDPDAPYAGIGASLERLIAAGANREDINQIVRGMQAELLANICYMLDDNGLVEPEIRGVGWGLFQTTEEGDPVESISGLHESVLVTDPTGREMRPKKS